MQRVRPAAVAGSFYPDDPAELNEMLDELLAGLEAPAGAAVPKAVIVPHAGYVFSGRSAAHAYARLAPARDRIRRVVLLGPAHREWIDGLALPGVAALATPLGEIPVDAAALTRLVKFPQVETSARAHAREHSIEVHLPFLQRVLDRVSIVPLVVGGASPDEIAEVLDEVWGGPETAIVVSSDLSHYLPDAEARRIDGATAGRIARLEAVHPDCACGAAPVDGLLETARRRGMSCEILDLRNSSDSEAGSPDRVVGYGAFAFHERGVAS